MKSVYTLYRVSAKKQVNINENRDAIIDLQEAALNKEFRLYGPECCTGFKI